MRYENIGTIDGALLTEFKAYAKIVGSGEDAALGDILAEALLSVAEVTDRAMMSATLCVEGSGVSRLRLYQLPHGQIVSVKDGAGNDVEDYVREGNEIVFRTEGSYRVSYTVAPDAAEVRRYKYYAFQLASAMYDGNDEEKTRILGQIPASFI